MNNNEIKNLCIKLMNAKNSPEVVDLLKEKNLWDDKSLWKLYGNKEGSYGTANSQGNALFALTEKVTNAVDAVLMSKCFEDKMHPKSEDEKLPQTPIEAINRYFETDKEIKEYKNKYRKTLFGDDLEDLKGQQVYWDDKKTKSIAENICVAVGGEDKHGKWPNIAIVDKGEGQTPEKLPNTIMSLHEGNKKGVNFAQGKWNQGGSGAIVHCGGNSGIHLQFVLTKRNPKIIKNFHKEQTPKFDEWSFTILRRDKAPRGTSAVSGATFLCPSDGLPLSFKSETMPIFPDKSGNLFGRTSDHGTVILLYEYKVASSQALRGKDCLYRQLDVQLPKVPLPIRVYETRKRFTSDREQSLSGRGFSNFQENQFIKNKQESSLEDISPRRGYMRVDNYKIKYDIFCFKKGLGYTYIPKSAGLLWTVNGQTHGITKNNFFDRKELVFNEIARDLLIVIDCTDIDGSDREDFFKATRDRIDTENRHYKEVRDSLIDQLKEHADLKEIIKKRIDDSINENEIEDQKTLEELQKLLEDLSDDEKDFLPPGLSLKKKVEKQEGPGKFDLPKNKFPTYFCFKELKNSKEKIQHIKREIEIGKKISYDFSTDVVDEYFERQTQPGKLEVEWVLNDKKIEPRSWSGPFLQRGNCKVSKIELPEDIKPGDFIDLNFKISDKENIDGFSLTSSLIVKPKQKKIKKETQKKQKENKEKIIPEGSQGINTVDEVIQNPIIAQYVSENEWEQKCGYKWSAEEVLHVKKIDNKYYLFLNRNNKNLIKELDRASIKNPEKVILNKYRMGISLIAMFTLMQQRTDKNIDGYDLDKITSENDDVELEIKEEVIMKLVARNAGKGLFALGKYLESVGKIRNIDRKTGLDPEDNE